VAPRVKPPGKMPGRRRWVRRLLGACLAAAVLGWPATHASAAVAPPTLPPPTGLNATAADSAQITLSWTAPTPPAGYTVSDYAIYEGTSPGAESSYGNSTGTSYTVTGLTSGTTYYFYVIATASQNCLVLGCPAIHSLPSSELSAATGSPTLPAPTGLTATAAGSSQIRLSWTAPAATAGASLTGYKIYDGTSSGAESPADSSTSTSYTGTGLTSGTTYYFEVTAVYQVCSGRQCSKPESPVSNEAHATTNRVITGPKGQVISFGPLASHVVGVSFTVSALASSRLPVSFGSDTPRVCSVSGRVVTTVKRGRCTITASQPGNTYYAPAPDQTQSFRVKPLVGRLRPQTITFAGPAGVPTARRTVRLSASASSGLLVSFRSDTPGVCSVSGRVVTTVKDGRCTITATQAGNTHYAPAPDQTRSFQVDPVPSHVPRALIIVLVALLLAAIVCAAVAGALRLRWHWRQTRERRTPKLTTTRIETEPRPDSPGTVHLRVTGPDVSGAVRIEPHQAYVYSRLERAQR
jgi:Fibronectin type III domain